MQTSRSNTRGFSKLLLVLMMCVALLGAGVLAGCQQQPANNASSNAPASSSDQIEVFVSIDTTQVPDAAFNRESPGINEIALPKGATAYDALEALDLDLEGSPSFVTSIGGLASGDYGPMSGWMFTVNGETPSSGSDSVVLSPGDTVEWVYVQEFPGM